MNRDNEGMGRVAASIEGEPAAAQAVVREIAELLRALLERDEGGSIDVGSLPLGRADLEALDAVLGEGEVYAEVDTLGVTEVRETGVAGVWWITHHNEDGAVIAEFIEVTYCPEILMTPVEDVKESWEALRARLLEAEYLAG